MPRTTGKPNKNETSAEAFVRLAKLRVPKAVKAIRLLQNLANYEHTASQAGKIDTVLTAEIAAVKKSLTEAKKKPAGIEFDF